VTKAKKSKKVPKILGPLPVDLINQALETELEAGDLIVPVGMDVHISRNRPGEYARLEPHLAAIIKNPLYVGDDFKNNGFELIGCIPGPALEFVLVAVCI
jgi:hypothetical protein